MSTNSVIVEFVGLPGVGKSTLSHRAASDFKAEGSRVTEPIRRIDDRSNLHRVLSKGRFATEHTLLRPRTAFSLARILSATEQRSTADYVRVGFNLQYVAGVILNARSTTGVTLLDQGPYQGVWSAGLRSTTDWESLFDRFDRFLSRTSPDLLVLVEADRETITERLRSRKDGDTRFDSTPATFDHGLNGYEALKNRLDRSNTGPKTIVVENETRDDLQTSVNRITDAIST